MTAQELNEYLRIQNLNVKLHLQTQTSNLTPKAKKRHLNAAGKILMDMQGTLHGLNVETTDEQLARKLDERLRHLNDLNDEYTGYIR